MLPVKTPLTGRSKPEFFSATDETSTNGAAVRRSAAETDFGRIMDRTKISGPMMDQPHPNHRSPQARPTPPIATTESPAIESTLPVGDTAATDESKSEAEKLPTQTTDLVQNDPGAMASSEAALCMTVNLPLPALNTLPIAAGFCGVTESAPPGNAESLPCNNAMLSPSPLPEGNVSKPTSTEDPIANLKPTVSNGPANTDTNLKASSGTIQKLANSGSEVALKNTTVVPPTPESATSEFTVNLPPVTEETDEATISDDKSLTEIRPQSSSPAVTKNLGSNSGTGVATVAGVMKKAEKPTEVAGLGEKVLPGGKVDPSSAPQMRATAVSSQNSDFLKPDVSISFSTTSFGTPVMMETAETATLPSLAETQLRTLERTAEMMTFHVTRLAKSDTETMQVVIRPGAGTELSLELRQHNGKVEIHATLQRGDHQVLNQYWPELQERLEQRGVKLASLSSDTNYSSAGNGNFSRQQHSQREEAAQQAGAFAEFTIAMNRGGATARLATTTPGANEWWA